MKNLFNAETMKKPIDAETQRRREMQERMNEFAALQEFVPGSRHFVTANFYLKVFSAPLRLCVNFSFPK